MESLEVPNNTSYFTNDALKKTKNFQIKFCIIKVFFLNKRKSLTVPYGGALDGRR